jgi:hypothetical protein
VAQTARQRKTTDRFRKELMNHFSGDETQRSLSPMPAPDESSLYRRRRHAVRVSGIIRSEEE